METVVAQNEQTLNFKVTLQEANIIMQGLGELPAKTSITLINNLQKQAQPQISQEPKEGQAQSNPEEK